MRRARWARIAAAVCAVVVSTAGCADESRTPSALPATATAITTSTTAPVASPTPGCSALGVLADVRRMLAIETFEAHVLTIGEKLTISVWLVDPAIDPAATDATLTTNNREALDRGLAVGYEIVHGIPCAVRVFDQVNPMVVDRQYESWYIDFLPVAAFAGLDDPTPDELLATVKAKSTGPAEGRRRPPQPRDPAAPGSCGWPEAKAAVMPLLLADRGNSVAYFIVGGGLSGNRWDPNPRDDAGVEVQWTVQTAAEASDAAILDRLGRVAQALGCLAPPVDSLEAFVVGPTGRLIVYVRVPAPVVRSGLPLRADAVYIQREASGP